MVSFRHTQLIVKMTELCEDSRRSYSSAVIVCLFMAILMISGRHAYAAEISDSNVSIQPTVTDTVKVRDTAGVVSSGSREHTDVPNIVHPPIGEAVTFGKGFTMRLAAKIQNYTGTPDRDPDILSPKSVNIHPSGKKFYVNSLEGGKTVVYSLPGLEKLTVIRHRFNSSNSNLWAPASGFFQFRHYTDRVNHFVGKPVESAFSHNGRFLWVPYYRRSFDINAQDPSAIAIIDTHTDTIARVMEAGVLPKMVAVSHDGSTVAVAHWGDNTVGLIDASSYDPKQWKYKANVAVGRQLFHNFSLTETVDRDKKSGEALRGSVFTPDSRYLLVGCMSGGGIAVIDVERNTYLGKLLGMMPNVRHIVIKGDWLYSSVNIAGYVQRVPLSSIMDAIERMGGSRNATVSGWQTVKVAPGARTLEPSPNGDYIFVACNFGSAICIVDSTMRMIAEIPVDSYPVGLDVSPDGRWLISTSQGRKRQGGHCVDIFELSGLHPPAEAREEENTSEAVDSTSLSRRPGISAIIEWVREYRTPAVTSAIALLSLILLFLLLRKRFAHSKKNH